MTVSPSCIILLLVSVVMATPQYYQEIVESMPASLVREWVLQIWTSCMCEHFTVVVSAEI